MTYSIDFRRKVLSIRKKENLTIAQVAKRFYIGIASVTRWLNVIEPKLTRNKPATKIDMNALAKDVENYPDAYQYERGLRLGVAEKTVGHALRRMGISYKKNFKSPKSERRRSAYIPTKNKKI
jgi:transposase